MRTNGKPFLVLAAAGTLLLAPVVSSHAELKKKADPRNVLEKSSDAISDAVESSKRAVKWGAQKTGAVAAETAQTVRTGLRKISRTTANAASKVKDVGADAMDAVKQKFKETTP